MRKLLVGMTIIALAGLTLPVTAEAQAPTNISPPEIEANPPSTAYVGATVADNNSAWTAPETALSIHWFDCDTSGQACVPIPGATAQAYTIQNADLGHTIRVQEIASDGADASEPVQSAPTVVVSLIPTGVDWTSQPVITGLPAIGQTLTVSTGTWTGTAPITYTYQWQECRPGPGSSGTSFTVVCKDIPGANARTYTVAKADGGAVLFALVTGTNLVDSFTLNAKGYTQPVPAAPHTVDQSLSDALTVQPYGVGPTVTVRQLLAAGGFQVMFTAFGPGTFTIQWASLSLKPQLVASARLVIRRRGTYNVNVKLTRRGRALLQHNHRLGMHLADTFKGPGRLATPHNRLGAVQELPNGSFSYVSP